MPSVEVGDIVFWYPHGETNRDPIAAWVTKIDHESVDLNVLFQDNRNFSTRQGVRHITDPKCRSTELREEGGWDHRTDHKTLFAIREMLEQAKARKVAG